MFQQWNRFASQQWSCWAVGKILLTCLYTISGWSLICIILHIGRDVPLSPFASSTKWEVLNPHSTLECNLQGTSHYQIISQEPTVTQTPIIQTNWLSASIPMKVFNNRQSCVRDVSHDGLTSSPSYKLATLWTFNMGKLSQSCPTAGILQR